MSQQIVDLLPQSSFRFNSISYTSYDVLDSHIDSKYKPSDLVSIDSTFPSLKIQNLSVAMDDMGPVLDISITFENPLKLSLSATGIEAGIAVDGIPAARIAISDIKLFRGLQTLTANARVRFNDSTIDVTKLGPIISDTLSQMLFNPSPNTTISLVGPVRLKSAGFAEEISSTLSIRLPMKEMFAAFKLSEIQSLLSTSDGIKTVLSKSSFSANVTSQLITAPITMVLPRYLPLPDKIIIPAFASAGIYGGSQHTVTVGMSPIVVETTDDAIKISTIVTMLPNNTMAAANALADVVNPILESVPKVQFGKKRQRVHRSFAHMQSFLPTLTL